MGHVFISHGSEDRDEANALCAFVESHGVKAWIAPRDVRPGGDYSEELQAAIESCAAFVVLVTDMANKSPYVRAETEMAFSNSKPIFPVRTSEIKPAAGLAFFLKIRHWTDAFGKGREAGMARLALELQTLSGVAATPAPAAPTPSPPAASAPAAAPAPAAMPPPVPTAPAMPVDQERLAAAIGPNATYYMEHWRKVDEKGAKTDWNWAACFANLFWFAYRKMWIWLGAMALAIVLLSAVGAVRPALGQVTLLVSILLSFVSGGFGNHLYRRQITALAADPALDRAELERRGGVSKPALFATIGAVLALVALAIGIAAQQMRPQPASPAGPAADTLDPADNAMDGGKPAGAAGPADSADAGSFDAGSMIGRWADVGDCANAIEFTADGRFTAPGGGAGTWSLQGDQLTLSGPGGTQTVQVTSLDQNAMYAVNPDGSVATSQRC